MAAVGHIDTFIEEMTARTPRGPTASISLRVPEQTIADIIAISEKIGRGKSTVAQEILVRGVADIMERLGGSEHDPAKLPGR